MTATELRSDIVYELMRDHGCSLHNGPGSGACRTCQRRADIVMSVLAAAHDTMNAEAETRGWNLAIDEVLKLGTQMESWTRRAVAGLRRTKETNG